MHSKLVVCLGLMLLWQPASFAVNLGLQIPGGENVFDEQFIEDYERARVQLEEEGSAKAMLGLLQEYKRPLEQAELELTLGLAYNQRSGLVDPAKAVERRGLVACSYHDLSREWPEIEESPQPIFMNSSDPENETRARDYRAYRYKTDFIRHLLTQKYFFVDSVRRAQKDAGVDDRTVLKSLENLTPDTHAVETVKRWLSEENNRPWP